MGRRWSDEQLAVALDPSLTCAQAAIQLNRTIGAVHAARMMYPEGRTHELGRSRRWSNADIAILTDPALSTKEIAERLGRSVGSVYYARHRFTREVAPNQHGTSTGWQYGCKCGPCQQYNRDKLAEKTWPPTPHGPAPSTANAKTKPSPAPPTTANPGPPKTSKQPATQTFPYWMRPCN